MRRKAEDVTREVGVSRHTIYAWKAKYGGMEVSETQEAKQLRDENARLKKLVVDLSLDKEMLMEVVNQRADADWLRSKYAASQRRVCGLMGTAVSSYRYRRTHNDEPLRTGLVGVSAGETALRVSEAAGIVAERWRAFEPLADSPRVP
jgi:putative transposase